jgi:hypothetical protein
MEAQETYPLNGSSLRARKDLIAISSRCLDLAKYVALCPLSFGQGLDNTRNLSSRVEPGQTEIDNDRKVEMSYPKKEVALYRIAGQAVEELLRHFPAVSSVPSLVRN